jgi:hypothetical protein
VDCIKGRRVKAGCVSVKGMRIHVKEEYSSGSKRYPKIATVNLTLGR